MRERASDVTLIEKISRWEPYSLPGATRWGLAVLALGLALLTRYELEGSLPPGFPYLTFFPAILVSAYFLGTGPGIAVAVASGLAAWYFFIPPFNSFELTGATVVALIFFVFVAATEIGLTSLAQHARRDRSKTHDRCLPGHLRILGKPGQRLVRKRIA